MVNKNTVNHCLRRYKVCHVTLMIIQWGKHIFPLHFRLEERNLYSTSALEDCWMLIRLQTYILEAFICILYLKQYLCNIGLSPCKRRQCSVLSYYINKNGLWVCFINKKQCQSKYVEMIFIRNLSNKCVSGIGVISSYSGWIWTSSKISRIYLLLEGDLS